MLAGHECGAVGSPSAMQHDCMCMSSRPYTSLFLAHLVTLVVSLFRDMLMQKRSRPFPSRTILWTPWVTIILRTGLDDYIKCYQVRRMNEGSPEISVLHIKV
ncbi:hypothetical protein PMIN03_006401 [Paraphaeosphaeria minitans]